MHRKTLAAIAALVVLAACSGQQNGRQGAQGTTARSSGLRNPLDFPLYPGSSLISTHSFTQVIAADTGTGGNSLFANGNGTYDGHEVVAASSAAFSDLSAWVDRVNASPPPGYVAAETSGNPSAHVQAQRYGMNYAAFSKKNGGRTHGLLLIVMDPQMTDRRLGAVLGLIAKYRALPPILRAPLDNEAKSRIGMTISQATQPDSPIGAALAALDQFEHKDSRGIVVLDAAKR